MPDESDDVFADFEQKARDDKGKKTGKSDEQEIKDRFESEQERLKVKYEREMNSLKSKKAKQSREEAPETGVHTIERISYIAIIIALLAYAATDLVFFHGKFEIPGSLSNLSDLAQLPALQIPSSDSNETAQKEAQGQATNTTKIESQNTTSTPKSNTQTSKPKGSGNVLLSIDDITYELKDEDTAYITRVTFTIANEQSVVLNPVVNVFIFDNEIKESWEERSRGTYKDESGIPAGKVQAGSVDITPKTFKKLNLEKTIRIELNDTKAGFLKSATKEITLE